MPALSPNKESVDNTVTVEQFKEQYEVLRRALDHSRGNEDLLIKKVRELKDELVEANCNLKISLQTAAEYKATIKDLTYRNAKSLRAEAASRQSVIAAQKLIDKLKEQVGDLAQQVKALTTAIDIAKREHAAAEDETAQNSPVSKKSKNRKHHFRSHSARLQRPTESSSYAQWKKERKVWTPSAEKIYRDTRRRPRSSRRPNTAHAMGHVSEREEKMHAHEASAIVSDAAKRRRDVDFENLRALDPKNWGNWGSLLPLESHVISERDSAISRALSIGRGPAPGVSYSRAATPLEIAGDRLPTSLSASSRRRVYR